MLCSSKKVIDNTTEARGRKKKTKLKASASRQMETLGNEVTKTERKSKGAKPMSHASSSKKVVKEEKVIAFIRGNPLGLNIIA